MLNCIRELVIHWKQRRILEEVLNERRLILIIHYHRISESFLLKNHQYCREILSQLNYYERFLISICVMGQRIKTLSFRRPFQPCLNQSEWENPMSRIKDEHEIRQILNSFVNSSTALNGIKNIQVVIIQCIRNLCRNSFLPCTKIFENSEIDPVKLR
jgi:hypothetical protein